MITHLDPTPTQAAASFPNYERRTVTHTTNPDENAPSADEIIRQLGMLNAFQLGRIIAAAEKQRAAKLPEARDALMTRIREEAGALGLDLADLFAKPAPAPGQAKKATQSGGMRKARAPIADK